MEGWPASLACAAMAAMVSQVSTKRSPLVVGFVGAAVALGWNSSKQYFFLTTSSTTRTEETSSYAVEEFHNDMSSQSYEVCMKFNSTEVLEGSNKARTATEDASEVEEYCANQVDCFPTCDSDLQEGVAIEPLANVQCLHHIANQVDCFLTCESDLQGVANVQCLHHIGSVQPLPSETDRTEVEVARPEDKVQKEDGHEEELIGFLQKLEVASPRQLPVPHDVALSSAVAEMNNVTTTGTELLESVASSRAQTAGITDEDIKEVLVSTLLPQIMAVDVANEGDEAVEGHTSKMPSLVDKFEGFEVGCAELIWKTVALGMGSVERSCEEAENTHLTDGQVQSDGTQAESMHEGVGDGGDVPNFLSSDVLLSELLPETLCDKVTVGDASDQQELTDPDDKILKALTKDAVKEGVRLATEQHVARLRAYDEYLADPKVSPHMKSQVIRAKFALQNFYDFEFQ